MVKWYRYEMKLMGREKPMLWWQLQRQECNNGGAMDGGRDEIRDAIDGMNEW